MPTLNCVGWPRFYLPGWVETFTIIRKNMILKDISIYFY